MIMNGRVCPSCHYNKINSQPVMVKLICNPSSSGGRGTRMSQEKNSKTLILKTKVLGYRSNGRALAY
jgi:hypothetical protein